MRITSGSDWRDTLVFERPVPLGELAPGDPARCAGCGTDAELLDREELWAVKHRHPTQHAGFVRFYCVRHVPAEQPAAPASVPSKANRRPRASASSPGERMPSRRVIATDVVRAVCPDCFVEISASGVCGSCGERVG